MFFFLVDISVNILHKKSCVQLDTYSVDVATLTSSNIINYQLNGYSTISESSNKIIMINLNRTDVLLAYNLEQPIFVPGFTVTNISSFLNTTQPCFAQCNSQAMFYDPTKGPSSCGFILGVVVPFSSINFALWVENGNATQSIPYTLSFSVMDSSDYCYGTSNPITPDETQTSRIFEGWLYGAPSVVVFICLLIICCKQKRVKPTPEEEIKIQRVRKSSVFIL